MASDTRIQLSTGLKGFDAVVNGIIAGDNIVWQVDSIDDYLPFVRPYCKFAKENKNPAGLFSLCQTSAACRCKQRRRNSSA